LALALARNFSGVQLRENSKPHRHIWGIAL
jgi:hypothetical protein